MKITFIGLGIMGQAMATNLLKNGTALTVYNRSLEKAEPLKALGATVAQSAKEAVAEADLVISMLADPSAVEQTFLSESGILKHMKSGSTWIDCSTVDPEFSRLSAAAAQKSGVAFIDAPVAGSKPQAEAAVLSFFVGTTAEGIAPFESLLLQMGQKVIPFDTVGHGSSFKMVVNMLLGQSMVIFSEAIQLGTALNIDPEFLLKTLPKLPVTAPFTALKTDNISNNTYPTHFPLEHMLKDLRLATQAYSSAGKRLAVAETVKAQFEGAAEAGRTRQDFSAIHAYLTS
ncbi:NAD(P)-dependent oxidoreductase [Gilvibacter sediminis]|uniref:NAD(P)-dependent oxidoreductase n=1 Tax=Gilvibacter sediminis TaxID=379071 RepID=UPI002350E39D|nr:NAD(P)-dependent oxidoreductase [Gilvibacter sediminis]MDC7998118.1 NAD(P)-dependent oxidoreductase [Gilvibacter sediminis]